MERTLLLLCDCRVEPRALNRAWSLAFLAISYKWPGSAMAPCKAASTRTVASRNGLCSEPLESSSLQ